ncbi:MAG: S8 family serine peptidase [Baekduia sp.]
MHVLIQVRPTALPTMSFEATAALDSPPVELEGLADVGFVLDERYAPVVVPAVRAPFAGGLGLALGHQPDLSFEAADISSLVRGTIPEGDEQNPVVSELLTRPEVMGVFADPVVEAMPTCGGDPPVGNDADVARLLDCAQLHADGFTGEGVRVAVVDSGINAAHLASRGHTNAVDVSNSFTPAGVLSQPGAHGLGHGTMCSFDIGIAAPEAVLLDHAVLLSRTPGQVAIQGLLSDAVRSFSQLRALLHSEDGPPLVVSNSWGVFDPAWDFPVGHPGNYTDNPGHPFNLIVSSLERAGADILFAAGNCGVDCPDGRCRFMQLPICGANSHPAVLSIAGIDVKDARVGYSSQGPGRISADKPDVCSYTHFKGSEVFGTGTPDSGTSAACPVAAGVVAAIRTRVSHSALTPAQLRALIQRTATDLGHVGFDHDHGWGALTPPALVAALP